MRSLSNPKTNHVKLTAQFAILALTLTVLGWTATRLGTSRRPPTAKVLYYQDSMHPSVKMDQPGSCPVCGMALTPILEGETGFNGNGNWTTISSNSLTVAHVATETVRRREVTKNIRVAGVLEVQESRQASLAAPAAARIDYIGVDHPGMPVKQGDALVRLFSPDLAQRARYWKASSSNRPPAVAMSTGPDHPSGHAETGHPHPMGESGTILSGGYRLDLFNSDLPAPISGVVSERLVSVGQYVMEGQKLMTVIDPSVLWFRFDVSDRQLSWLDEGQQVQIQFQSLQGRSISACIETVEPSFDASVHLGKVRAALTNVLVKGTSGRFLLQPGMVGEAQIPVKLENVLAAPKSAVIYPGHSAWVYVDHGHGTFERRRVRLGRDGDDWWEVLGGLKEGDQVVTSGNLLIDSQVALSSPSMDDEEAASGEQTSEPQPPKELTVEPSLTGPQLNPGDQSRLGILLKASDRLAAALARDNLVDFNNLPPILLAQLSTISTVSGVADLAAATALLPRTPATNIKAARQVFLPFASATATLATKYRGEASRTAGFRIYHCSMAPKPGLWLQLDGPLQNPYFGASMLTCGEEVETVLPSKSTPPPALTTSDSHSRSPQSISDSKTNPTQPPARPNSSPNSPGMKHTGSVNPHADKVSAAMSVREELKNEIRVKVLAARDHESKEPPQRLTELQVQTLTGFLHEIDQIGRHLAAENLDGYNSSITRLQDHFQPLLLNLGMPPRWGQEWEGARVLCKFGHAVNLEDARLRFAPLSALTVEFAHQLIQRDNTFNYIKFFGSSDSKGRHVWIQLDSKPSNPFTGAGTTQAEELTANP
jgi:membrane fusion protein, copper/silver efflux system